MTNHERECRDCGSPFATPSPYYGATLCSDCWETRRDLTAIIEPERLSLDGLNIPIPLELGL